MQNTYTCFDGSKSFTVLANTAAEAVAAAQRTLPTHLRAFVVATPLSNGDGSPVDYKAEKYHASAAELKRRI